MGLLIISHFEYTIPWFSRWGQKPINRVSPSHSALNQASLCHICVHFVGFYFQTFLPPLPESFQGQADLVLILLLLTIIDSPSKQDNYRPSKQQSQNNFKNHLSLYVFLHQLIIKITQNSFIIEPRRIVVRQSQVKGAQQIYYHLFSKLMSVAVKECPHCDQVFKLKEKFDAHMNQHLQPHELVPKTNPNHIQKVGLSKVLHLDDSTDESDIAVRSILPDQMPRQEVEKRDISAPGASGFGGKEGKVGGAVGPGGAGSSGILLMRGQGAPANDRLDLDSNPVRTDVQRYDEDPLNIEKVVDLKPKKTMVARKEIHKYQNSHNAARQTIDTGGCDRKVQGNPLSQSRNIMMAPPEPVYEIKEDVKPFLSLATDPKATATVSFSRKTGQASPYSAIDTKSVIDPNSRGRLSKPVPIGEQDYDYDGGNKRKDRGGQRGYQDNSDSGYERQKQPGKGRNSEERERRYPLHPHECPDCHGFYCMTCKSTIPPSMRPFWDENEKPEMIQYYKSLQKEYERQYEQRWEAQKNCKECHNHGHKKVEQ